MSEEELKAINARCEAATPGPWVMENDPYVAAGAWPHGINVCDLSHRDDMRIIADGYFITHARADVPALVAEVERLKREMTKQAEDSWKRHVRFFGGRFAEVDGGIEG